MTIPLFPEDYYCYLCKHPAIVIVKLRDEELPGEVYAFLAHCYPHWLQFIGLLLQQERLHTLTTIVQVNV